MADLPQSFPAKEVAKWRVRFRLRGFRLEGTDDVILVSERAEGSFYVIRAIYGLEGDEYRQTGRIE